MKRFFTFFLLLFLGQILWAQKVEIPKAKTVAAHFMASHHKELNRSATHPDEIFQADFYAQTVENDTCLYIFKMKNNDGFVILSANENHIPVLGFSFESDIDFNNMAPALQLWLRMLAEDVAETEVLNVQRIDVQALWQTLYESPDYSKLNDVTVGPLLYSKWNQNYPYNTLCPSDPAGPGGYVYVGCVATAMAQIMNYYRHPQQGQGQSGYNSSYGYLHVNYGQAAYNYEGMPKSINQPNFEISQIGYHAAVSVAMGFSPSGSGAQSQSAAYALRTYFKYASNTQMVQKSSYTNDNWNTLLMNHIDARRPLYYAGYEPGAGAGHAFVCDGYKIVEEVKYFHFNWGWSGNGDAFVLLTQMNSGNGNFYSGQQAIINIYPAGTYPNTCSGARVVNTHEGSIDDGSGPAVNYQSNNECTILLAPEHLSGTGKIQLTFNYFETNQGTDVLYIYDGDSEQAPLIGSYSGSQKPPTINSTGDKLFFKFTTGNGPSLLGWSANFTTTRPIHCSGLTILTEPTGTFDDGSGDYHYNDGSMCRWRIEPPGAEYIVLTFNRFNTEPENDYIIITNAVSNQTVATVSGNEIPAALTIPAAKVQLRFVSNTSITGTGWEVTYHSSATALPESSILSDLSIWPNPAMDVLKIRSSNLGKTAYSIEVLSITGQVLLNNSKISENANEASLDVSSLPQGIYLIRVADEQGSTVKKFIKK